MNPDAHLLLHSTVAFNTRTEYFTEGSWMLELRKVCQGLIYL